MTKASKIPPMPRELAFLNRSASLYHGMKGRFRERKYKSGRLAGHVFRAAREIPFTLVQFQDWLSGKLGGPGGAVQCRYCKRFMTAIDISVDHVDPISQGGSLDLDNLDLCCDDCNRLKGSLTLRTFTMLLAMMQNAGIPGEMTVADRKNLESRLKSGGMQYRGKPQAKKAVSSNNSVSEPAKSLFQQPAEDDF